MLYNWTFLLRSLFFFFLKIWSEIGVRIIHGRALYPGKYGKWPGHSPRILMCSHINQLWPLLYEKIKFWHSMIKTTHPRSLFTALDMICIKKYTGLGLHNLKIRWEEAKSIKCLRGLLHIKLGMKLLTSKYVVKLCQLAESCEFEGLCESSIRDRLVLGTRDSATRDRLHVLGECPVPGLTRCIEALRASKLSRKHKELLTDAVSNPQNTVDMNQSKVNKKKQMTKLYF